MQALIKAGDLVVMCSFGRHISAVRGLVCVRGTWAGSAGGAAAGTPAVDNLVEVSMHGFYLCFVVIHPAGWYVRLDLLD